MNINIIACLAQDRGIGYEQKLLFHIPEDMRRFRALTTGHTLIMGRKTYESLPNGALPQRRNIVISHQNLHLPGCEVYHSVEEALPHCQDEMIFVIGGESIYREMLPYATTLYLTIVDATKKADTFFPCFSTKDWEMANQEKKKDEKKDTNQTPSYIFETWKRKNKV